MFVNSKKFVFQKKNIMKYVYHATQLNFMKNNIIICNLKGSATSLQTNGLEQNEHTAL